MQDSKDEHDPHDRARDDAAPTSAYLRFAGAGMQLALTFLGLGLIGWWLDSKLGTAPWLLIAGIVLGAAGGMYSLVVRVGKLTAKSPPEKPSAGRSPGGDPQSSNATVSTTSRPASSASKRDSSKSPERRPEP
jgi:F0F1-type ATP synthase assembly protein I